MAPTPSSAKSRAEFASLMPQQSEGIKEAADRLHRFTSTLPLNIRARSGGEAHDLRIIKTELDGIKKRLDALYRLHDELL